MSRDGLFLSTASKTALGSFFLIMFSGFRASIKANLYFDNCSVELVVVVAMVILGVGSMVVYSGFSFRRPFIATASIFFCLSRNSLVY